jgi:hypothetical protein
MKNVVFWDIKTVRTSQKTHYVSTTEREEWVVVRDTTGGGEPV